MHPGTRSHIDADSQYFYVLKRRDYEDYPRCCTRFSPPSTAPRETVVYKEGVVALGHVMTSQRGHGGHR